MTALLALISGAGIAYTLTAGHYRKVIRRLDVHGYDSQWTRDDIEAIEQEKAEMVAFERARTGQWRRRYVWAEQVARDQAEQLAARWRTPIPLPARRSPMPDYGSYR